MPRPKLPPPSRGDACNKCRRTDVDFYPYSRTCKVCRSSKAASYYKERYWHDEAWRVKQKEAALTRHAEKGFDLCRCGEPKQTESNLCKACWERPLDGCIQCGAPRDRGFHANKCRDCTDAVMDHRRQSRQYAATQRAKTLYQKYGLTIKEFNEILQSQGNACAVCSKTDWGKRGPVVDHDHRLQGRESVRGILCNVCNTTIGLVGDTLDGIKVYVQYLEKFELKDGHSVVSTI